jgi:hypothetical protein
MSAMPNHLVGGDKYRSDYDLREIIATEQKRGAFSAAVRIFSGPKGDQLDPEEATYNP